MAEQFPIPSKLTPNFNDVLVVEERAVNAANDKLRKRGTFHPNKVRYPHHVLAWVEPVSGNKDSETWYWVAKLDMQHEYNYEFTNVNELAWPGVTQTWVIPRKDYKGDDFVFTPPPIAGNWTPMSQRQSRSQEKWMDSLFVIVIVQWQDHTQKIVEYTSDERFGIVRREERSVVPADNVPTGYGSEQKYLGNNLSLLTERDLDADYLNNYHEMLPDFINMQLPDELLDITAQWSEASGDGSFDSEWNGAATGTSFSLSGAESGDAQGGASIVPDVVPEIVQYWGANIPVVKHYIFMQGDYTISDVANKLGVNVWPLFKPKSVTISLKGSKISVNARASASAHAAMSGSSVSRDLTEGEGTSQDVSVTHTTKTISPTLHGVISISNTTRNIATSAEAEASWTGTGTPITFPSANAFASISANASGSITPSFISATSPPAIPKSGSYLVAPISAEMYSNGWSLVVANVVNASVFA